MTSPQHGPAYTSVAVDAELPSQVARIIARDARVQAAAQRCRPPTSVSRRVLLGAILIAVAAGVGWLGMHRPGIPNRSGLRGGSGTQLEEVGERFCSKVEADTEFHTQAPLYWKDYVLSAEMCCAECDGDPECGAWTWGEMSGVAGLSNRCFLKKLSGHERPRRFKRKGVVSGFPSRVLRKHGVVAGILAKDMNANSARNETDETHHMDKAHEAHHNSERMCLGNVSVMGRNDFTMVAAQWYAPGQRAAGVEVPAEGWEVAPRLAARAYMASACSDGEYNNSNYLDLKLLGRTLRYTVDLSSTGCGCNAQVHFAAMRSNANKSACMDYFCSAASSCGVRCTEFALQDANQYAWSTSFTSSGGNTSNGVGYGGSGAGRSDWGAKEYGPGAKCIDTAWPFQVTAAFPTDHESNLEAVELTLMQENKPCILSARLSEASLGGREARLQLSEALAGGLTPFVAYEASNSLSWLDGLNKEGQGPCVQEAPEACPASVRFYNFAITDGHKPVGIQTDGSLPEMAINMLHQRLEQEAAQARKDALAKNVKMRLIDDVNGPCQQDCDRAGSKLIQSMSDQGIEKEGAKGEYEESASGNSEWEVVTEEVHLLSEANLTSERLALRQKGDILVGKRVGGWVRLLRQPGFAAVLADDGRTPLLRERFVVYEKITSGTCQNHSLYPIEDPRVCEMAAFSLGYFDLNTSNFVGPADRPEGCYLYKGAIYLNAKAENIGNGVAGARYSICSSGEYRVTSTTTTVTLTTTTTTTWGFPSLFCFEVMMRHSYEYGLVRKQIERKAGIFNCDEYAVFSQDGPFSLGQGPDGPEVEAIWFKKAPVWRSEDNTAANALLFMNVFKAIKKNGRWKYHHWVIKADPDAVVLPWRLRHHLAPVTNQNNYLVNCNKMNWKPPFPMIFGAMEAYSNQSLTRLFNGGLEQCTAQLNWRMWGEDKFLGNCMKLLGVQAYMNFQILADNRCTGAYCGNPTAAAFHDFKNENAWFNCWDQATK